MEFPFDINHLFTERVSVLDQNLVAGRKFARRPDLETHVETVIDELGRASAKAQQLTAPVTSASKLQLQGHQLYLLKDGESNGGRGVVVGFLKVGYKKLFLLDQQGLHIEAEPLCVLDFYIAENLQRHGYGLELFDFMLQHKNLEPVLMAYDRPSPKFLSFLAKHYCLTQSVPQVNHFVVFDGFFVSRSVAHLRKAPLKKPDGEIKPYSVVEREVVRQEQKRRPWPFAPPHSPQRSVSSQYSQSLSVGSSPTRVPPQAATVSPPGAIRDHGLPSPLIDRCRARRTSQQGLVARGSLYSRHMGGDAVGHLGRHSTDLTPVVDTDTGSTTSVHAAQSRSQHLSCPPSVTANTERHLHTRAGDCGVQRNISQHPATGSSASKRQLPEREKVRRTAGWSWSVGQNCYTAQWVKQKQQYRSTRPW